MQSSHSSHYVTEIRKEIYRHLFYASSGNARNLGHILNKIYENYISYGRPIGIKSISDSSGIYYEEKIEPYFGIQKFTHETFGERSSIFSLKEQELGDSNVTTVDR